MTVEAHQAAAIIKKKLPDFTPKVGIILGSGLGALVNDIEAAFTFPYETLPGFPECGVVGHGGELHCGYLNGIAVAVLAGRSHYYEGYSANSADKPIAIMKTPIRALKLLGAEQLFITNSGGSLRKEVGPGSLVLIEDHINFQFNSPLVGPNDDDFGPRFVSMDDAYNANLRQKIVKVARDNQIAISEGVYLAALGPAFETHAEIRAFKILGADVVGMSTVADTLIARHCDLKVAAISVITNLAAGMSDEVLSHEGTLKGAKLAIDNLIQLIKNAIKEF